ncbi:hypothetical protein [Azospirillum palustre]
MSLAWEAAAAWGALGGVLPDVIKTVRSRFQKRPDYLMSWFYWVNLIFLAVAGAGVAVWRDPHDVVEAVSYGAAALAFFTQVFALPDDKHLGADDISLVTRIRRRWGS